MSAAAVATVALVAAPAQALTVSGAIRCADCAGGVGLVALDGEGGFPLAHLWLERPGPYEVELPDLTESVELYAFRDADADGLPDPGAEAAPHPENPVALEGEDLAGIDLEIPPLPDVDVELSGTIACADCAGGVGLVVRGAADGFPLAHLGLAEPGPYAVAVPIDAGEVEVYAYRDADGNGVADPGTELVACGRNPVEVGDSDVSGLDVDLGSLPDVTATLSGRVQCGDCAGGVGLIALAAEGGLPLAHIGLPVAGPFALEVPHDAGEVELWAYRDADGDGVPDPGTEAEPFEENPVAVGREDIEGLDITLPPLPDVTTEVSGRIRCGDCAGGVGLVATTSPRLGGFPLAHLGQAEPGEYTVSLPINAGEVSLYAYRDADLDGVPDPGSAVVESPDNPIVVLDDDIEGIDLDLGELPTLPAVELSGVVTCGDCTGVSLVVLSAEGGFPLAHLGLDGAGPWSAEVPEAIGEVEVWAFRDDDLDGAPDPGTSPAACEDNPVEVGLDDIGGLDLDLGELPSLPTVRLSGTIACADCAGALGLVVVGLADAWGGFPVVQVGLDGPGPYEVEVPEDAGEVEVWAFRDADGNGAPDWGTEAAAHEDNPVDVGSRDVSGIDLDLGELGGEQITLAGEIVCESCDGPIAVEVTADDLGGWVLRSRRFAERGPFELRLPARIGKISLYGFRDDDGDGRPDMGCDSIAAELNPIEVGADDIAGAVIDVTPCFMPDEPAEIDPPGGGRIPRRPPSASVAAGGDGCGCRAAGPDRAPEGALLSLLVLAALMWLRTSRQKHERRNP